MKILFACNTLHGFFNFRKEVLQHFVDKGAWAYIIYPEGTEEGLDQTQFQEGCQLCPCKFSPNGKNPIQDIKFLLFYIRVLSATHPDIAINYTIKPNIYGTIAASLHGIPVIDMVPGLGISFSGQGLFSSLLFPFYSFFLRKADYVVVLNEDDKQVLQVHSHVDESRLVLFSGGEGINLDYYSYIEGTFEKPRFVMISRLLYDKGFREFVEVARLIHKDYPEIEFDIAGSFNNKNKGSVSKKELISVIQEGEVNYLGYVSDIRCLLSDPNIVVVLPSYYREGMNRSLMEAAAVGRPIITTDLPGLRELVEDGYNGYLIEPRSVPSLLNAVGDVLLLSSSQLSKLGENGRKFVENRFGIEKVLCQYDEIIESILSSNV